MSARRLRSYLPVVWAPLLVSTTARVVKIAADIALVAVGVFLVARLGLGLALPVPLVGTLLGIGVVSALARYLEQFLGHWVAFRLLARLRVDFYEAIVPLAPAALAGERTGDLVARVTDDVDRIETFYAHTIAPAVAAGLVPAATIVTLGVVVDGGVGAVLLPFLLGAAALPFLASRLGARAAAAARAAAGETAGFLADTVAGLAEIVAFADEGRRLARLDAINADAEAARRRTAVAAAWRSGIGELLTWGGTAAVLVVGARQEVGIPELAATVAAAFLAFRPLEAFTRVIPSLEAALAAAGRVFAVVDRPAVVTETPSGMVPVGSSIRFEDVTFGYEDLNVSPILEGVTAGIPERATVGIVGASGSGKSTLVNLLLRYWDPGRGRVLLGGVDLRDIRFDLLRSRVGSGLAADTPFRRHPPREPPPRPAGRHRRRARTGRRDGLPRRVGRWPPRRSRHPHR